MHGHVAYASPGPSHTRGEPWIRRRARPRWREPLRSPRAPSARVATLLTAGFRREQNPSWLAPDRTRRPVFRGCSSLARPGQSAQIPQTRQRRRRRGRRLLLRGSSSHGACWKPAPGTPSKQFGRVGGVAALHQERPPGRSGARDRIDNGAAAMTRPQTAGVRPNWRCARRRGASGILPTWKVPWTRRNERSLADTHGRSDGSRRNRGRRSSRAGGAFRDRVDARRSEAWREAAW